MAMVVVFEFGVMRCQPLRRALCVLQKGKSMNCYICENDANEVQEIFGDYREVDCAECGPYKVSCSVLAMLSNRRFDTEAMQRKLTQMREETNETPMITSIQAKLVAR